MSKQKMLLFLLWILCVASNVCSSELVACAETTTDGFEYQIDEDEEEELIVSILGYHGAETEIVIPSFIEGIEVTDISYAAFKGNTTINSITISENIESISSDAFVGCCNLENINVVEDNAYFYSHEGSIYTKDKTEIVVGNPSKEEITVLPQVTDIKYSAFECCQASTINLPDSLERIEEHAFYGAEKLSSIAIPSTVTFIDKLAFAECIMLENIVVDENNSVYCSDNGSIYTKDEKTLVIGNPAKEEITILAGVTTIKEYAFWNATNLKKVNMSEGVEELQDYAFCGCGQLNNINIPQSVTKIGLFALVGTPWLSQQYNDNGMVIINNILVEVSEDCSGDITIPTGVTCIASGACYEHNEITSVDIPKGVTSIGEIAFGNCSQLSSVSIPEGVIYIGEGAFQWTDLSTITLPSTLESMEDYVFYHTPLTNITIPAKVKTIPDYAFTECNLLTTVVVERGVTSIGNFAFGDCSKLSTVVLSEGITTISGEAFEGCGSLLNIEIPKSVTTIGVNAFENTAWLKNKIEENPLVVVNGILIDGTVCSGDVVIPEGVIRIGESAFWGCWNLTSVKIPNTVTSIEPSAFAQCYNLESIEIPKSVTTILGGDVFRLCPSTMIVYAEDGSVAAKYAKEYGYTVKPISSNSDSNGHTFSEEYTIDNPATCTKPGSKSRHCTDEGCTEKTDVTAIPATGNHTYDTGVMKTLPTCVAAGEKIYTCTGCGQTKTEAVAATGTHTFTEWAETKAATGDVTGEKTRTCSVCAHQETETIPAMGYVKGAEFSKGKNTYTIKSVKGKKGTVIYEGTEKTSKKVSVPKTVKVDGKTYTVTEIAEDAFKDNTKITSVTIPEGVTKIGKNAFSGCKKLKTITIKSTKLKTVGKNAIKGIDKKATIKVPSKQLSKYQKLFKSSTGFKKTMKIKK